MLEANCKLLKENRQITAVFKEKSIQQNYVTKISLLHLNLRCKAVVELRVAMMEKKKRSAARLAYKNVFPFFFEQPHSTERCWYVFFFFNVFFASSAHAGFGCCLMAHLLVYFIRYTPIKVKLEHPPPQENPGHFTIFCARGVGNLTRRSSRGGEFDLCLGGVGKIKPELSGFKWFFWGGGRPKSLLAINPCLEEMEEFKGRDRTFVAYKKGSSKVVKYLLRRGDVGVSSWLVH